MVSKTQTVQEKFDSFERELKEALRNYGITLVNLDLGFTSDNKSAWVVNYYFNCNDVLSLEIEDGADRYSRDILNNLTTAVIKYAI